MPELMNLKSVMVINDEAQHCYREKQNAREVLDEQLKVLKGTERTEARKDADDNRETARLWISGLEILQKKIGILRVFDLSATPFFPERFRLGGRHAVPLDHERLFPHGCHRVRYRQTAPRSCGRHGTDYKEE